MPGCTMYSRRDARGSMWKSDKWSTLTRFPLGFFGGGSRLGFGLENQPVRSRGGVGGREQDFGTKFWQISYGKKEYGQKLSNIKYSGSSDTARTWPSYPEMFALATICVSTGPNVVALYVLLQLLESLNC